MHRPDPNPDPNRPELADAEIQVSSADMQHIKDNLTKAEAARRQGETQVVFDSYKPWPDTSRVLTTAKPAYISTKSVWKLQG